MATEGQRELNMERMGRCARLAWEHAVDVHSKAAVSRSGVMTGHLLLGVLEEPQCAGGLILAKMQLDLKLALSTTNFVLHYGRRRDTPEEPTVEWEGIPHTRAAHAVLACAWEEADLFYSTFPIGTEHLLLGLLRVPEGMGYRLLGYFGIELDRARAKRDEFWKLLRLAE